MAVNDETMIMQNRSEEQTVASMILEDVYHALEEKGIIRSIRSSAICCPVIRPILRATTMPAAISAALNGTNSLKN